MVFRIIACSFATALAHQTSAASARLRARKASWDSPAQTSQPRTRAESRRRAQRDEQRKHVCHTRHARTQMRKQSSTFSWWRFLWWSLALRPKALRSYSASSWGFLASFFRFRSKWSNRKPWLRSKSLGRQRGATAPRRRGGAACHAASTRTHAQTSSGRTRRSGARAAAVRTASGLARYSLPAACRRLQYRSGPSNRTCSEKKFC